MTRIGEIKEEADISKLKVARMALMEIAMKYPVNHSTSGKLDEILREIEKMLGY